MKPEDVDAWLVEKAYQAYLDDYAEGVEDSMPAILAAVLPLHETGLLEVLRLIDGEMAEADDFDGLNADAVQRIGWYIDTVRARLRAAETESEGSPS